MINEKCACCIHCEVCSFIDSDTAKAEACDFYDDAGHTGHWKRISMDKYSEHAMYWYRCDKCGKDNLGNTAYCPNCGAKMVEPQESEDEQ